MNDIEKYFRSNNKRLIHKWVHYFDIYDRYFHKYRNKNIVVLEIGVSQGGSLQMWKSYFGSNAQIFGIDINPRCKDLEEENVKILIGSQSDRNFLREVKKIIPPIDILIDDGGHTMLQQTTTFEELLEHVKDDGVYVCEDLHTSYSPAFGGGYKRKGTFIEFIKNKIDSLNAYYSEDSNLKVDEFTKSAYAIHCYDNIVVFEKRRRDNPYYHEKTGTPVFDDTPIAIPSDSFGIKTRIKNKIKKIISTLINRL